MFCCWVTYTHRVNNILSNECSLPVSVSVKCVEKKNQQDANEWFIALIICSTYFRQIYAHHQELKTVCVLLRPMVCNVLVAGGQRSGAGWQAMRSG